MTSFLTTPAPHTEGAAFIRKKPALTRAVFNALHPDLQARAFLITGVECLDTVARVRELTARLSLGEDYDDLKSEILGQISPWLITATNPEEAAKQKAAAARRAELLLRMHGWQAYAQTQDAMMRANEDVFPYRMYISSEDAKVRPSHAALNKKVLPANHPFWQNHTPPWEYNCRCDCVPMTQEEVDELAASEAAKAPEDKQVMPPEQLREIEDNARIVKPGGQGFLDLRSPRERSADGSWYEFRPGDKALDIDQILQRFTPLERRTFEDFAARQTLEDGRSLLDWWRGSPATAAAPAPAAAPAIPASLPTAATTTPAATTTARPVSDAITHHPKATKAEKAVVQSMLDAIDEIHGDGQLRNMPVRWAPGTSGHYAPGREIKIAKGGLKYSQLVHELGHKIDAEGAARRLYNYASTDPTSELADVMTAIRASQAVANLHADPVYQSGRENRKYRAYQLNPKELWARAYAQFIAEESGHKQLLAEIDARRSGQTGYWADSQWEPADFDPIRTAIKAAFMRLGWLPAPGKTKPRTTP